MNSELTMAIFKNLSREAKVIMTMFGSAVGFLCSDKELLALFITQPLETSIPIILPKLLAGGLIGGSLYNMNSKKDEPKS